ncbi:MAG: cyclic nucleotide-binding domain-containing protein [Actinomycetota bacterium]|nr:cyclic nucleotide-binding domain-containing protein [Actinomycetota bacterium]
MCREGEAREYQDGEVIFNECDPGKEMFIIQSGKVKVTKKIMRETEEIETTLAILKKGDFFGEMALFEDRPRSATVTAMSKTEVLVIDKERLKSLIREDPDFALKMLEKMSHRIREIDDQVERLSLQVTLSGRRLRESMPWIGP